MKVSIAMCTYNGAKYIRKQLDSVLRQTESDFELIVCDDCSTDETVLILNSYAKQDKRVQVCQNEVNMGFYRNFEHILTLCHGDYIAPCDQDDIWTPDHLEVLLSILGKKTLAVGNAELIDADDNPIGMTLKEQEHLIRVPKDSLDIALTDFLCRNPFQGACMLFRHSFLEKVLPFPNNTGGYHDTYFACMSCFMDGLEYTPKIINSYRIHGDNASGMHDKKKTRPLIKRAIKSQFWSGRIELLEQIKDRELIDNKKKKRRWQQIWKVLNNASSRKGKLLNLPFIILHLRTIISN